MKNKRKLPIIAIACLMVVCVLGGTIAYWQQQSTIENPFDTGKYGSTIREDFEPDKGENWQPGVRIDKNVKVKNTGDVDLLVRVKLEEKWTYKSDALSHQSEVYKQSDHTDPLKRYDPYVLEQDSAVDGKTEADKTVVEKHLATGTNWAKGADNWYYYKVNLTGGQTTDSWLEAIELKSDADMGKMITTKYVTAVKDAADDDPNAWFPYTGEMPKYINDSGVEVPKTDPEAKKVLHNKTETTYDKEGADFLLGYSQSDYKLTVTTQTIQATKEAVDAVFGGGSAFTPPTGSTWVLSDVTTP